MDCFVCSDCRPDFGLQRRPSDGEVVCLVLFAYGSAQRDQNLSPDLGSQSFEKMELATTSLLPGGSAGGTFSTEGSLVGSGSLTSMAFAQN